MTWNSAMHLPPLILACMVANVTSKDLHTFAVDRAVRENCSNSTTPKSCSNLPQRTYHDLLLEVSYGFQELRILLLHCLQLLTMPAGSNNVHSTLHTCTPSLPVGQVRTQWLSGTKEISGGLVCIIWSVSSRQGSM